MAVVVLTDPAVDDLRRAGPVVAALLLGRLRILATEPDAGAPLVDARTGYRLVDALGGAARIVFSTDRDEVTVHEVWVEGARTDGEAYAEALERIRVADPSEQVALARILRRLGRLTGARPVPQGPPARAGPRLAGRRAGDPGGPGPPRRRRPGRGHGLRRVEPVPRAEAERRHADAT